MTKNCLNCTHCKKELSNFKDQIFCIRIVSHRIPTFYCRLFEPDRNEWTKELDYYCQRECSISGHERKI